MQTKDQRALHDLALAIKPDDAEHDVSACEFCKTPDPDPGDHMPELTQEQVDAAIAKAVGEATAELKTKLEAYESDAAKAAREAEIAAAVAPVQEQLDTVLSERDTLAAEKAVAEKALVDVTAYLEAEQTQATEAAAIEARKAERVAEATDKSPLEAEYIEANADRFAAMSDEDWTAKVEEWELIAAKLPTKPTPPTVPSALQATRPTPAGHEGSALSSLGELYDARRASV